MKTLNWMLAVKFWFSKNAVNEGGQVVFFGHEDLTTDLIRLRALALEVPRVVLEVEIQCKSRAQAHVQKVWLNLFHNVSVCRMRKDSVIMLAKHSPFLVVGIGLSTDICELE
jgi:hypothetical protein